MKGKNLKFYLFLIIAVILAFELVRDSMRAGDFIGYVKAGDLVLSGKDIYSDRLNTWPPFFSIFAVLLALGDRINSFLTRFLWLGGGIVSMFFIAHLTAKMFLNRNLVVKNKKNTETGIYFLNSVVFIPFIIVFRFLISNLANVQINIYMLLLAVLSIYFFSKRKELLAGMFLALGISLKVYILFILIYFIYKREFRTAAWTLLFLFLFNGVSFLVFGIEQAVKYYSGWYENMVVPFAAAGHKNQSFFSMVRSILCKESPGLDIYVNIFAFSVEKARYITYSIVMLFFIFSAFLFRKKLSIRNDINSLIEYSVIFSIIPLFSPLAWKAYFIFLWLPYFTIYLLLFRNEFVSNKMHVKKLKFLFYCSIVLNVFTVEGLMGRYLSDVAEVFSCITIGSIILLVILISIFNKRRNFS